MAEGDLSSSSVTDRRMRSGAFSNTIPALKRIAVIPEIRTQSALDDLISRLAWYFTPYVHHIDRITLHCSFGTNYDSIRLPPDFDPYITSLIPPILSKIKHQPSADEQEFANVAQESDLILLIDSNDPILRGARLAEILGVKRRVGGVYEVDAHSTRMEGSFYLWAGLNSFVDKEALSLSGKDRFAQFATSLPQKTRAYVFGTGPSLSDFVEQHDFTDGHTIVSNSIVKNLELMEKLQPAAVCAADPIFHAGCSSYAGAFRRALVEAMDALDFTFITAQRDYAVFEGFLPNRHKHRVIAIPFAKEQQFNTSILNSFAVQPLPNILTLLMLPVAAALAEEIAVAGCDGRPRSSNSYFWGHDQKAQFNEEMESIKRVHPGFFNIDYNDYYDQHCADLERVCGSLEAAGHTVVSMTPSHIPALARRQMREPKAVADGTLEHIVVIESDGLNESGHFLAYASRIWEACQTEGVSFTLLGRHDLDRTAIPGAMRVEVGLSINSWSLATRTRGLRAELLAHYKRELSELLAKATRPEERVTIYTYCGSVEHAQAIADVLETLPNARAVVNLFYGYSASYSFEYVAERLPLLRSMAASGRVALTAPTGRDVTNFRSHFGLEIPLAPHPSTTFSDAAATSLAEAKPHVAENPLRVLFPGGVRPEKGFAITAAAAPLLGEGGAFVVTVRTNANNSSQESLALVDRLRTPWVQVEDGPLDNRAFTDLLRQADIIVCPYLPSHFASRTSGLLVDALILGRPVVAIRGTWLGHFLEQSGFGVAAEPTAAAIVEAVEEIARDYDRFALAAAKKRAEYLAEHSWAALVKSILRVRPPRILPEPPYLGLPREDHAQVDETLVAARLLSTRRGGGYVMIDVGAHHGASAASFLALGWAVHCFEPDPENRSKLETRMANRSGVTIDPRAVGERALKGVSFYASSESTGISGLHAFHATHRETAKVDVTTIAEIVAEHGLKQIDFLKIDVEGLDFSVLKGVPWDRIQPDAIECEFEDAKTLSLGHSWRDIAEFLSGKGYAVYVSEWHPIVRYGVRHDWRRVVRYSKELELPADAWGNFLAFKQDPGEAAVRAAFEAALKKAPPPAQPPKASPALPAPSRREPSTPTAERPAPAPAPPKQPVMAAEPAPAPLPAPQPPVAPVEPPFYAEFGEWLRLRSPRLFGALRMGRRGLAGVWRRRVWTLPALFLLAIPVTLGFEDAYAPLRGLMWGGAAFAFAMLSVLYLALRVYQYVGQLAAETAALRAEAAQSARLLHEMQSEKSRRAAEMARENAQLRAHLERQRGEVGREIKKLAADAAASRLALENRLGETARRFANAAGLGELRAVETAIASLRAELTGALERLQAQKAALKDALAVGAEANAESVRQLRREIEAQQAALKDALAAGAEANAESVRQLRQEIEAQQAALKDALAASSREARALKEELSSAIAQSGESTKKAVRQQAELVGALRSRVVSSERQIGALRFPDAPSTLVFFGHHKCGSRFFRNEVFSQAAEMTGSRLRKYEVRTPPFHYSRLDELDLCNIDFQGLGVGGRDVVMFANASARSLAKIQRMAADWKGVRIIRDPRQVLVSNYFHHRGEHHTELNGWIWDKLVVDKPVLRELPKEEGLLYELDNISKDVIENQVLAPFDDPRILTLKLEEFGADPQAGLAKIAAHLEIADIAGIFLNRTGANPESGPWVNHFTSRLREVFKERYGQALIDLGYAEDFDW